MLALSARITKVMPKWKEALKLEPVGNFKTQPEMAVLYQSGLLKSHEGEFILPRRPPLAGLQSLLK